MESQKLSEWVGKFWKGESSQEEELRMDAALKSDTSSDQYADLKSYRKYLQEERKKEMLDEAFDQEMLEEISRKPSRPLFVVRWGRVAAVILLLFSLTFGMKQLLDAPIDQKPITSNKGPAPHELFVYQEVKKALFTISSYLNEAMAQASVLGTFHQVQEELKTKRNNKKDYGSN